MPPPPSFISITSNPFARVVTQAEFNGGTFGGVANEVWFQFIASAHTALGLFTDHGGTFTPQMSVFQSDGTTLVQAQSAGAKYRAMWADLVTGTYYIRVRRQPAGASNFDFTFNSKDVPIDGFTVPVGAIVVNDDTSPLPAAVLSPTGTLLGFLTVYPAGEIAAALPSGVCLMSDAFGQYAAAGTLALIDATQTYVLSNDLLLAPAMPSICANQTDFYVVSRNVADYRVFKVSATGVVTGPIATLLTLSSFVPTAIGVNNAGTIAYYVLESIGTDPLIHRWDLVNDVALSDLYTVNLDGGQLATTLNGNPGEILVLADDSIVTWLVDGITFDITIIHLSPAGVLLDSKFYSGTAGGFYAQGYGMDHLTRLADSTAVKVWLQDQPFFQTGLWFTLTLAMGVESDSFRYDLYSVHVGLRGDATDIPGTGGSDGWPAPSESCWMLALLFGSPAPPACVGLIDAPRIDGLPYVPPVVDACGGTGERGAPRIGA